MRRKSIPAAAPVLMSSKIESNVNIETCLRTEKLYLNNVLGNAKCETTNEENEKLTTNDVPSKFCKTLILCGTVDTIVGNSSRRAVV